MQGLSMSFIMLAAAEMVGGRKGMGYYVKSYSILGDYTRTIAGVLMIGTVIVLVTFFFNAVKKRFIRWK
jgi:NitT/TauT family transport system permease protein